MLMMVLFLPMSALENGSYEEACGAALRNQDAVRANLRVGDLSVAVDRQTESVKAEIKALGVALRASFNSWTESPVAFLALLFFSFASTLLLGTALYIVRNPVKFAAAWSILVSGVVVVAPSTHRA